MRLIKSLEFALFVLMPVFVWFSSADAGEKVMVTQFNPEVRIVLTNRPCPMLEKTLLAVAQRIDRQFMRGCYTYEPTAKLVRIQWSEKKDDFSMLDADKFKPAEIK